VTNLRDLPQVSNPLPWHDQEWSQLTAQLAADRLPHALIFAGRKHIGKAQLALALSRLLLCTQPDGSLNCGRCHSCALSAKGNHGDFRWVEPIENSRIIKIDQIREVLKFTSTKAGIGSRKVIVFAPADRMNSNAFNGLLKSLEEPAIETYIILVCSEMQSIPATIRSRCQLRHLATPATGECLEWLDTITHSPQQSQSLLAIAGGLPLLAQRLYHCDDAEGYTTRHLALDALATGRLNVHEVALLWIDQEVSAFLELLGAHVQLKIGTLSTEQLKMKQLRAMFALLDEVNQFQRSIISGANPNRQLMLVGLLSKYRRLLGTSLPGVNILTPAGGVGV
jgi:DNA polymerase-3 subunit delta'